MGPRVALLTLMLCAQHSFHLASAFAPIARRGLVNSRALSPRISISASPRQQLRTFSKTSTPPEEGADEPLAARFKTIVSTYGPVATVFHLSVDALTVGLFYCAISAGVDVKAIITSASSMLGVTIPIGEGASTFAAAYAITTAVTGIPRTFLTIAVTPAIARRIGWGAKPSPTSKKA